MDRGLDHRPRCSPLQIDAVPGGRPRSPNLNAYAERFVRSIKSECLAQVIPLGERHLRRCVSEYVEHYHRERNHQGLGNELVERQSVGRDRDGPVECRERLGGVLRYYRRAA